MTVTRSTHLRNLLCSTLVACSISAPLILISSGSALAETNRPSFNTATNSLYCLEFYNAGPSIDIPNMIGTASGCYELRLNGQSIEIKRRSLAEAIADLENTIRTHPGTPVDGYFDGVKIGYELYWDGVRVGYEPAWTLQQAIENLQWNQATYPDKQVEGRFYGYKIGYELYWNGTRVGYEPGWTYEQALQNLQLNRSTQPNIEIKGFYNGFTLP